jgi:hypothetical protein
MSAGHAGGTGNAPGAGASGAAGGRGGGGNKGKKDKLKCGENGKYGDLKKKTAGGRFDRDHVPSKAALKEFARKELRGGRALCPDQASAIDNLGNAIAIPKAVHSGYSPTYGGKNTPDRISEDAGDLQTAAKRDTADVAQGMEGECKKKYQAWAKKVNGITNSQYKKMLSKAIGKPRR